jgi:glyoxylase-like metal-dependent hydrolase (beta-lactamase superfamily II)
MPQEIEKDLYRIEIPLPETPLKYLNAYVIRGRDRHLLVDTGLNHDVCLTALRDGLEAIDVDLADTDIFITHLHADHFGLVSRLASDRTRVYFNRPDAEIIESWEGFGPMLAYAGRHGFPVDRLRAALKAHPGSRFGSDWVPPLQILSEGDSITVGDYVWQCVETPGHTMGHTCLYDPSRKLLIAGDHLLIDITPNIQCWSDEQDPLRHYLASLDKVDAMDVNLVLPGHRRLFADHHRRISELKRHHRERLAEVVTLLAGGSFNAYETAARMTWDLQAAGWSDFPVAQQWFATGEALSHLRYLEVAGQISRRTDQDIVRFSPMP